MRSASKRAYELLRTEFGDENLTWIDDEMIHKIERRGYVLFYLVGMVNIETCSTAAKTDIVLSLAKCDLELGITLETTVFSCCTQAPKKEIIKSLINVDNGETMQMKVKKILEFKNELGLTCLMICPHLLIEHGRQYPESDLVNNPYAARVKRQIEDSIVFLIELGVTCGVNMAKVINHTTENGGDLFGEMTSISEKVSKLLTTMNVKVNTIDNNFQTATIKVRSS